MIGPLTAAGPMSGEADPVAGLLALAVLFIGAKIGEEVARRLGQPGVVGELAGGFLVGPHALALVTPGEAAIVLAELGVVVLLFKVGLEVRVDDLLAVGRSAIVAALIGVTLPFILAGGVMLASGATGGHGGLRGPRARGDEHRDHQSRAQRTGGPGPDVGAGDSRRRDHRRCPRAGGDRHPVGHHGSGTCPPRRSWWRSRHSACSGSASRPRGELAGCAARSSPGRCSRTRPLVPAFILMLLIALLAAAIGLAAIIGALWSGLIVAETEAP